MITSYRERYAVCSCEPVVNQLVLDVLSCYLGETSDNMFMAESEPM